MSSRQIRVGLLLEFLPQVRIVDTLREKLILGSERDVAGGLSPGAGASIVEGRVIPDERVEEILRTTRTEVVAHTEEIFGLVGGIIEDIVAEEFTECGQKLLRLGKIYEGEHRWNDAFTCFRAALEANGRAGSISLELLVPQLMGRMYRRLGNLPEGLNFYRRSLTFALELDDKLAMVIALVGMGNLWLFFGNLKESEKCYRQALNTADQLEDLEQQGVILHNLSILARRRGKYDEAFSLIQEGIEKLRETGARGQLARAYSGLGLVYLEMKEWEKAEEAFEQAYHLTDETSLKANIHANRSRMYLERHQFSMAVDEAQMAQELFVSLEEKLGLVEVYLIQGKISLVAGEDGGFAFFERALSIARGCDFRYDEAQVLYEYGLYRQSRNEMEVARDLLERARTIFSQLHATEDIGKVEKALAALNRKERKKKR